MRCNRAQLLHDFLYRKRLVNKPGPQRLEFAQMYAHFGTKVTVLEKMKRILPLEEPEVSDEMQRINVCDCRTVPLSVVPKAKAVGEQRGLIKLVRNPRTGAIVGCHIVSPVAAEMIHETVLAVKYKLTVEDIIDTVHTFPTFSEGIKLAAQAYTRDISVMTCCIGKRNHHELLLCFAGRNHCIQRASHPR